MAARIRTSTVRHVIITGASSGIGRASAIELGRRGAVRLILVARREAALRETMRLALASAGPEVAVDVRPCDLADAAQLTELLAEIADGPPLHALVNNAGVGSDIPFEDTASVAELDQMLTLNLRTPMVLVQTLLPRLARARGCIVNVSSIAGLVGTPGSPVYSATKWGLTGFSEALRARVAGHGIRVVCVQPGPVPTPGWPHAWLQTRPLLRRVLSCEADVIAHAVANAVEGRGGPAPVRPRIFALIPTLRGAAPWLVRWLLARAANEPRGSTSARRVPNTVR